MKKILSILLATVMLFSAVSCLSVGALSSSTADEATNVDDDVVSGEYKLGEVVVGLKPESPSVEILLADFEITESRHIGLNIYHVKFAEKTAEIVWKAIAVLEKSPYVKYAEPNWTAHLEEGIISTTEAPTQAVSVAEPTTEITATSSVNLKSSTSDTAETKAAATYDTVKTVNSNGTVQTGQSNSIIVLTLFFIISAAAIAVFMRFRYRD